MKIRITENAERRRIPFLEQGRVFDVQAVTEARGETVYFIHHAGDYLGIRGSECEVVEEVSYAREKNDAGGGYGDRIFWKASAVAGENAH